MKSIYLIVQGEVRQIAPHDEISLSSGNMIGIMECISGQFLSDYVAKSDCVLYPFSYTETGDFYHIFQEQPKYAPAFMTSAIKEAAVLVERYEELYDLAQNYYAFTISKIDKYQELCEKYSLTPAKGINKLESLETIHLSRNMGQWEIDFYTNISKYSMDNIERFCADNYALVIGELMHAAKTMEKAVQLIDEIKEYLQYNAELLLCEKETDCFHLFFELAVNAAKTNMDIDDIQQEIIGMMDFIDAAGMAKQSLTAKRFGEYESYNFFNTESTQQTEDDEEEGEDCFEHILRYAGIENDSIQKAKALVKNYREMPDPYATDETARRLRRELTKIFYDVYKEAFRHAMDGEELTPIVEMFLNFGFMDVQTVGENAANELYDLTEKLYMCQSDHIFTIYQWLKNIYDGNVEPSRNEFDMDYMGYLHEQRRMGKITAEQETEMKSDNWAKVEFEIDNMFMSTNRATYGKISIFCPILSEKDMINAAENMLVTARKIETNLDLIRNIDFSIFYQEVIFTDTAHGVNKEMLQKEVLPNIILMPNAGTKAMMWQETAGVKRDTPARFIFPIFTIANVTDMIIESCGRYRWEICRKIQGMRWNDITERSLTSEYCDYVQFYRKNHDLSADAKEKLKGALVKAKNNYREVFVADYVNWIKFESNGSFRLNKVARDIVFRYCPFNKEIRERLVANPMYQDMFSKYNIMVAREQKRITNFCNRYIKNGGEMTVELQTNIDFYNM